MGDSAEVIVFLGLIVVMLLVVGTGIQSFFVHIDYSNRIGSYYNLAVDSSTATLKLDYLKQYKEKVIEYGLNEGYGAWVIKLPDNKLENQMKVLNSVIERLERISQLDQGSFEYQQALYQISRNDLCHRGSEETANCYRESIIERAYRIKNAFYTTGLLLGI